MIQNLGNGKVQLILLQELTNSDAKTYLLLKKIVFLKTLQKCGFLDWA